MPQNWQAGDNLSFLDRIRHGLPNNPIEQVLAGGFAAQRDLGQQVGAGLHGAVDFMSTGAERTTEGLRKLADAGMHPTRSLDFLQQEVGTALPGLIGPSTAHAQQSAAMEAEKPQSASTAPSPAPSTATNTNPVESGSNNLLREGTRRGLDDARMRRKTRESAAEEISRQALMGPDYKTLQTPSGPLHYSGAPAEGQPVRGSLRSTGRGPARSRTFRGGGGTFNPTSSFSSPEIERRLAERETQNLSAELNKRRAQAAVDMYEQAEGHPEGVTRAQVAQQYADMDPDTLFSQMLSQAVATGRLDPMAALEKLIQYRQGGLAGMTGLAGLLGAKNRQAP